MTDTILLNSYLLARSRLFDCGEAAAVAHVLLAAGHRDEAVTWLEGHARGDDGGTPHPIDIDQYIDQVLLGEDTSRRSER